MSDRPRPPTPPGPLDVVRPRYGDASLTDVLPGVLAALGATGSDDPWAGSGPEPSGADPLGLADRLVGVRRVVVLLVDGLGWYQIPLAAAHAPVLADLAHRFGQPITAAFPSTTPTSLVSLGTGAPPGAHGVLGFRVNVPGTDRVLTHTDWSAEPDPRRWQPLPTAWERAAAAGIAVTVVGPPEFADSGLTVAANRGGDYRGAVGVDELGATLLAALTAGRGPSLVYGYHPDLDRRGHLRGVDSIPWRSAVVDLDRLLARLVDGLPADAALLVTADHGQLDVPMDQRFDLDLDPRLRAGVRLVAGEPRLRYLHTRPGAAAEVAATWSAVLGPAAWVATRDQAVAAGWYGPVPPTHLDRIGDVVVASLGTHAVLASRTADPGEARLVAYHGSCTATEMTVPLLVVRP